MEALQNAFKQSLADLSSENLQVGGKNKKTKPKCKKPPKCNAAAKKPTTKPKCNADIKKPPVKKKVPVKKPTPPSKYKFF